MELFEQAMQERLSKEQPLAARMRPRTVDEFAGQEHILAPGRLLRRAIQADQLSSLIFYGPPGTGKTTLASVIANTTNSHFETLNAVLTGVADIRRVTEEAKERRSHYNQRTILFVDEVHRWNKSQQDALLPWVENGTVILIGATTENPYFTVNRPLVSRSRIFQLVPLQTQHLRTIAQQALADQERGYGKLNVEITGEALEHIIDIANGDARAMLNALELAVETTEPEEGNARIYIDLSVAEESIQKRAVLYDKEGDYHFDTVSAFIKSMRGSDPDAALYWLAKMVYAGEDPRFIFRRMLIFAGEDIGLAAPQALSIINAAAEAFDRVGMPEGQYHLGMAALYLATAPKSNSVMAFFDAMGTIEKEREQEVPSHLKDPNRDSDELGHGHGYLYPHAYREHWVAQQYMPQALQGKLFYQPGNIGYEQKIAEYMQGKREAQLAAILEQETNRQTEENLTYSPLDSQFNDWLARAGSSSNEELITIRDKVFTKTECKRHHNLLILNADNGLLLWEAMRQTPEGSVYALVSSKQAAENLEYRLRESPELRKPRILTCRLDELDEHIKQYPEGASLRFDRIIGRKAVPDHVSEESSLLSELSPWLAENGTIVLSQPLPYHGQRLWQLIDLSQLPEETAEKLKKAEEEVFRQSGDLYLRRNREMLANLVNTDASLEISGQEIVERDSRLLVSEKIIKRWFGDEEEGNKGAGERLSYAHYLRTYLTEEEVNEVKALFSRSLRNQAVTWRLAEGIIVFRKTPRKLKNS